MIARAIENLFYSAAVTGTHRALTEMGMILPDATGTPVEQVRAIVGPADPAPAPTPQAIEDEPATGRKARTPR